MDKVVDIHEVDSSRDNSGHTGPLELPWFLSPLGLTVDKIEDLVRRIEKSDWIIDDDIRKMSVLEKGMKLMEHVDLFLDIDKGAGVVLVSNLVFHRYAEASMLIWRKDWLRRHKEANQTLHWIMDAFKLLRITAYVAETNKLALRFDEKIGMRRVGEMHSWFVRDGKPVGAHVFELLRGGTRL